ncbi:hypothetical protein [Thalassotalea montiporae]
MRISIVVVLTILFSFSAPSLAAKFSAEAMINECLSDNISQQQQVGCQGFFYGLISKKQALLEPVKSKGLVDRAYNSRTSTSNYSVVKTRKYGMDQVCLPDDIDYQTFKSVLKKAAINYNAQLDVESVTDILARHYSCK